LDGHALRDEFIATCRLLFKTYRDSLDPVRALVLRRAPRRANESDEALDRRLRSQYVDVCRFLLPAASLANVGMTANARILENMIRKMLSHELAEVREIGEEVKAVARAEVPTLVKYANAVPYLIETTHDFALLPARLPPGEAPPARGDWCRLIDFDQEGETKVLAAALYRFGEMPFEDAVRHVQSLNESERLQFADTLLGRLGEHDIPLRELEYASYTFDLLMDQGAYAEFKRHRLMTQTAQMLTARLGYAIPRMITEAGLQAGYEAAMKAAAATYEKLYQLDPHLAQYVIPNGYNRRVLARLNLREAYHFCQLRAASNAHFSIRRIASRMAEEVRAVHPALTRFMHLPDETWQEVDAGYFTE